MSKDRTGELTQSVFGEEGKKLQGRIRIELAMDLPITTHNLMSVKKGPCAGACASGIHTTPWTGVDAAPFA